MDILTNTFFVSNICRNANYGFGYLGLFGQQMIDSIMEKLYIDSFIKKLSFIVPVLIFYAINKIFRLKVKYEDLIYKETGKEFTYTIVDKHIKKIKISMIGGGGAAGITVINGKYFCIGSGGGSSSYYIDKEFYVTPNTIIKSTVGRGGRINTNENGECSTIKIMYPNNDAIYLVCMGGQNGVPCIKSPIFNEFPTLGESLEGGMGGESDDNCEGIKGEDGEILYPSQQLIEGKKGGISDFSVPNSDSIYGSGGCSTNIPVPLPLDLSHPLSENGNDGIIIIKFIQ